MAVSFTKPTIRDMGAKVERAARYGWKPGEGRIKHAHAELRATAGMTCEGMVIRAANRADV